MKPEDRQRAGQIARQAAQAAFAGRAVQITEYGARAGSAACQTAAIQAAIDRMSEEGGGHVVVPEGRFVTGALRLKSGVDLHLQSKGSRLVFTTEINETNYPLTETRWEGSACINYSPLIYAEGAKNIGLTGPGTLDGQAGAGAWWSWHHQVENAWSHDLPDLQSPARSRLRAMDEAGVPLKRRVFGPGEYLRPNFIQLLRCQNVLIEGVTLVRSPMWQLNPVCCRNVVVRGVTFDSHGPNNDGCDPESCENVLIEQCLFQTGDDCISLKSGRVRTGDPALACHGIVIRDNLFLDGHGGIAIGSEMSNDVWDVYAVGNRFKSPKLSYVLRFKSNARRGGSIHDIVLCDTRADSVGEAAVHATMLYEDGANGPYRPSFYNIRLDGLQARGGRFGIFFEALPDSLVRGLELENIEICQADVPLYLRGVQEPSFAHVQINGVKYPAVTAVFLRGLPVEGQTVQAGAVYSGGQGALQFEWELWQEGAGGTHRPFFGDTALLPPGSAGGLLCLTARDASDRTTRSRAYRIQPPGTQNASLGWLAALGIGLPFAVCELEQPVSFAELASLWAPLCLPAGPAPQGGPARLLAAQGVFPPRAGQEPTAAATRQELAMISMQSCGLAYQNASTTMPVCADAGEILPSFGSGVARSLYYGFMDCDTLGRFCPRAAASRREAVETLARVARFRHL